MSLVNLAYSTAVTCADEGGKVPSDSRKLETDDCIPSTVTFLFANVDERHSGLFLPRYQIFHSKRNE